jgi:hypothetical protein
MINVYLIGRNKVCLSLKSKNIIKNKDHPHENKQAIYSELASKGVSHHHLHLEDWGRQKVEKPCSRGDRDGYRYALCPALNVCSSPNAYVEPLILTCWYLKVKPLGRNQIIMMGYNEWDLKRGQSLPSPCFCQVTIWEVKSLPGTSGSHL